IGVVQAAAVGIGIRVEHALRLVHGRRQSQAFRGLAGVIKTRFKVFTRIGHMARDATNAAAAGRRLSGRLASVRFSGGDLFGRAGLRNRNLAQRLRSRSLRSEYGSSSRAQNRGTES